MRLNEKQREDLEKAAMPLMEFLSNPKLFHPHVTTIVDSERIILYEGVCSIPRESFLAEIEKEETIGRCGFCNNDGPITKDPDGLMCDKCWSMD